MIESAAQTRPEAPAELHAGLTSVVIVAADSGDVLARCVELALASSAELEIIIDDNDTRDGSVARLAARYAQDARVGFVYNGANLGFGAGCNRGAARARGDTLLFLNPDCLIERDTIARLRAVLKAAARGGVVGATQVNADGHIDPASRRRDPLLRRALMSVSGLARFASRWPAFAGVELPPSSAASDRVDAVSGALMLLSRDTFARIGGFDEGYFLHCEDLDLCRRVRDAGYDVVCVNEVRVVHAKGGSSRHRPVFVALHKHRGMWRWFRKFDPAARNPLLRGLVFAGIWTAFGVKVPLLLLRGALRARPAQ